MTSKYATPELQARASKARSQIAIHTRMGNEEKRRTARAEIAACRIESVIRAEAGYLDEERLNALAELMFEVEEE